MSSTGACKSIACLHGFYSQHFPIGLIHFPQEVDLFHCRPASRIGKKTGENSCNWVVFWIYWCTIQFVLALHIPTQLHVKTVTCWKSKKWIVRKVIIVQKRSLGTFPYLVIVVLELMNFNHWKSSHILQWRQYCRSAAVPLITRYKCSMLIIPWPCGVHGGWVAEDSVHEYVCLH